MLAKVHQLYLQMIRAAQRRNLARMPLKRELAERNIRASLEVTRKEP